MKIKTTFLQQPGSTLKQIFVLFLLSFSLLTACTKFDPVFHPKVDVDIELVADGLVSPLGALSAPDDSKRLFIFDQVGKIWIVDREGRKLSTPFLDLTDSLIPLSPNYDERGLLGLAFHPDYKSNGRFFVYYNLRPRPGGPDSVARWNNLSRISEFKVSGNPDIALRNSEKVILQLDDPQLNHNGGTIAFGPDRYLYIAIGDGGSANDVAPGHVTDWYLVNGGGNGQDIEKNLFGNILRLDINGATNGNNYAIPSDNPFVAKTGLDEIYAYGFRNPYRFSFDMEGSHQLLVGDAGQVLYEEISVVKKGGNYGWNVKEGTHCFSSANNKVELASCPLQDPFSNPLVDPVIELNNFQNPKGGKATTIIGGNVYRGKSIDWLKGKYLFGTYSQAAGTPNGELFVATPQNGGIWKYEEVSLKSHPEDLGYFLKGFGQDEKGDVYLTVSSIGGPNGSAGKVFKIVAADGKGHK